MDHRLLDPENGSRQLASPLRSHAISNARMPVPPSAEASHGETLLDEYMRTFRRHRKAIVLFAVGGLLVALLLGLGSEPVFRTRTSLEIRSVNGNFMNLREVAATDGDSQSEGDVNLQTQIKLLGSDSLLQAVSARLLAEPHPTSIQREDLLSRALRALNLGGDRTIPYETLVGEAAKSVKVKPLGVTRLIEVTCDSYDASFSAQFCNALTQTFEQQDLHVRDSDAERTSAWLTSQVADVRQHAEDTQRKLEAAVGGNGLMLSQNTVTPGEDRLIALQGELVKAEADRMQQQALAGITHSATPDALPMVQANPQHQAYETRLADLQNQLAALVPRLTEQNPKVILLRNQIATVKTGLLATQNSSTQTQDDQFAAARHREELLQIAYQAQEANVSSDLQKGAQVSLLRRELDSEQQLYQTLLQRAKEAGFAAAMQADTIRIVDPAHAPHVPFSPQRKLAGGAGIALGALFGFGFAFYKERGHRVFHAPGEITRFLNVQELGVIPSSKKLTAGTALAATRSRLVDGPARSGDAINLTRWNDNFSLAAEAYRNATLSILLSDTSKGTHSYVVSSPSAGEGKTTITSNLGVALSKSRVRVVLIDGDLRRPALHRAFGIENTFGLRDILRGTVDLQSIPTQILTTRTAMPNISVIPAGEGEEDIVELLHSSLFGDLLTRLEQDFDIILIDTPPVLHMADARIMAGQVNGAILVCRAGETTREEASDARNRFEQDGIRLVGSILNRFEPERDGRPGYYESYYRYQKSANAAEQVGAAR